MGQGHLGVASEGQTTLPTRLLQRQQANTCFLLGVRSANNTDCLSHCPRAQGARLEPGCLSPHGCPQERGKGSFCGCSCSFPTHTAVSFSLLFVNFPTTTKHLTVSPLSVKNPPPVQPSGARKGFSHGWADCGTKQGPCTSHCESASPAERLEMLSAITLETFTSNTALCCLPTLKTPLLPPPSHIQNHLQTGGLIWQPPHSQDHGERIAKF